MRSGYGSAVPEDEEEAAPLRRQWPGFAWAGLVLAIIITGTLLVVVGS
jgi:hypothetical protein